MAAILAFHAGKAVVQIAAIQIPVNNLFQIGTPETVLPGEILLIDPDEGFKIVLHTAVVIRRLRISWPINGGRKGHDLSPKKRTSCRHNVERTFYLSREIFTGKIADYASKSCIYSIILILLTSGRMIAPPIIRKIPIHNYMLHEDIMLTS
jgi:hypothetical protein